MRTVARYGAADKRADDRAAAAREAARAAAPTTAKALDLAWRVHAEVPVPPEFRAQLELVILQLEGLLDARLELTHESARKAAQYLSGLITIGAASATVKGVADALAEAAQAVRS
jgi:hypothetical protein